MNKDILFKAAIVLASVLVSSCSSSDEPVENLNDVKHITNMLSEAQPIQLTEAQRTFVNDNNRFTLGFLNAANQTDRSGKSFIYSPLSITYVLAMVNDAAIGQTEHELEQTLGFHEGGIQAVNEYCNNLITNLPKADSKVQLDIANAIFLNKEYELSTQFQNDMRLYYDAAAETLDFSSPHTLTHINSWCSEKTNGMIPSILNEVNPDAVSYLLNAIYFKADWASKFDKKNTKNETFSTTDGTTQLPLMHQNVLIRYLKTDTYSAVSLPYGSGLWDMTVLLPEEGKTTDDVIADIAQSDVLTSQGWYSTGINAFIPYEVDLKLPRFETTSDTDNLGEKGLIGLLRQMGIRMAFDDELAQIPNMANVPVYISMMRQKAAVKVCEDGSEAAAVTVAEANALTAIAEPAAFPKATFYANRPFVYVISEQSSGVILFVGKFTGN